MSGAFRGRARRWWQASIRLGGAVLRERLILVAVVLVTGGLWVFIELAEEVLEGDSRAFDRLLLLSLRNPEDLSDPLGPAWLEDAVRDVTALGSTTVLALVTLAACGFLLLQRKQRSALFVFLSVGGGMIMSSLLKELFERPRPDLVPHGTDVYTASFPSGHSMMSAAVYLTLGALLARGQTDVRLKWYLLCLAMLLTLCVGVSRVYLGVHWPTDVAAGWTAGGIWALASWSSMLWLQRRGEVEAGSEPAAHSSVR